MTGSISFPILLAANPTAWLTPIWLWSFGLLVGLVLLAGIFGLVRLVAPTLAQVIDTANRFYRGRDDLVLLLIDESRLKAKLKYEAPTTDLDESSGELFPHLYGELNVDAVVRTVELPCEVDGSFQLPDGLR